MGWTTPDDVRTQIQRLWDRGQILAARLSRQPLFPWSARLARPGPRELSQRFEEARAWVRALEDGSRRVLGHGYDVVYAEVNLRELGKNRVPEALVVPSEDDALALIGKRRQAESFDALVTATRAAQPGLLPWIAQHPLELLRHAQEWERILAAVTWFREHPRSGLYARQIDVAGVHSKFIEVHRRLLAELLDGLLPAQAGSVQGMQGFELRYGLRAKPVLVRFRVLDPRLGVGGLRDVSAPVDEVAALTLPVRRVFITENEINGLAFPEAEASIVVFGLGYGLERLGAIPWLREQTIFYWGDLDTHGFAILDKLRGIFAEARSFLMDRETLLAHRALWGREPERHDKPLARLTDEEAALYDDLRTDRLGERVRLEQEHIGFGQVARAVAGLLRR